MTYNWLKRAMAGQLSMESYAKIVKDKEHQMMMVHGDGHIGKEVGIILAAENPYIHQDVQEYIYDLTKPFFSTGNTSYYYYNLTCKSPEDIGLLRALIKNPSLSKETAHKIILGISLLFKEFEKINREAYYLAPMMHQIIEDRWYGNVLQGLSKSKALDSDSASELIYIYSFMQKTSDLQKASRYSGPYEFIDNSMSLLASNTSIKKQKRLQVAQTFFNPTVVSAFTGSEDMDSDIVIKLIADASSDLKDGEEYYHKIDNLIRVLTGIITSHNQDNPDTKKLHDFLLSGTFIKNVLGTVKRINYNNNQRKLSNIDNYSKEFLSSIAKKTSSEEERLSLLKTLTDNNRQAHLDDYSLRNIIGTTMSTGRVSEEFIDTLNDKIGTQEMFKLLGSYPKSVIHIFDKIYTRLFDGQTGSSVFSNRSRWISESIKLGIDCKTQLALIDESIKTMQEYFDRKAPSIDQYYDVMSYLQDPFWSAAYRNNYILHILESGHVCREATRKIMSLSFNKWNLGQVFMKKRILDVKEKIRNLNLSHR